jgi:hypothetical protein
MYGRYNNLLTNEARVPHYESVSVYAVCGLTIVIKPEDSVTCHIWASNGELLTGVCTSTGKTAEYQITTAILRLLCKLLDNEPALFYKVYDELAAASVKV